MTYRGPSLDEFMPLDATAQAELVRTGQVQPSELVEAAIRRIEYLNPTLNAVITPLFEKALHQAEQGIPQGPFGGVPLLLKDFFCEVEGEPYYAGMRFLRDLKWRSKRDTYLATKFRQAGFIFLGKTNLPELAGGAMSRSAAFGPTHNPWDLTRSAGGSSSGSAAAVAAGMTPIAHANDGYGSIRIPASSCGLVGLKPSRGRTSVGPGRSGGLLGNITEHVLTRSVRDSAAILDAVSGPMPGDLFVAPPPLRPYSAEVDVEPPPLKVGLLVHNPILPDPVNPECVHAVEQTGKLLESMGHHIEYSYPPQFEGLSGLGPRFLGVIAASGAAAALDDWSERTGKPIGPDDVEPATWARAEEGRTYAATQIHVAVQTLMNGVCRSQEWWQVDGFDLLVLPTMNQPPVKLTESDPRKLTAAFGLLNFPASIAGLPAISLPLHWTEDGLPVGVQLVADYGREDLLIQVAAQLEQANPWAHRWPSLLV